MVVDFSGLPNYLEGLQQLYWSDWITGGERKALACAVRIIKSIEVEEEIGEKCWICGLVETRDLKVLGIKCN